MALRLPPALGCDPFRVRQITARRSWALLWEFGPSVVSAIRGLTPPLAFHVGYSIRCGRKTLSAFRARVH